MESFKPVTSILSSFLCQSNYSDLPEKVVHEASRGLINWLACSIGGSQHDTVKIAVEALDPFFGPKHSVIMGTQHAADPLNAALINGISSHVLDYDDTHVRAIHPSAPILPAVFALTEWKKLSGKEFIHAYVLGVEAAIRIGLSVFPAHYDRGWHITGTAGVFGAAAASSKLLNLSEKQTAWALGLAATQSSGLREMFGSMTKSFHPGRAAHGGLLSALLAEKGYTSSERSIEAPRGFGKVMSDHYDENVVISNLGETYEITRNMYKPFACGLVMHAAIDASLQLREQHKLSLDNIAAIEATVGPLVKELTSIQEPATGLQGKFSIYHAIATALKNGIAQEDQFSTESVLDPEVIALRKMIKVNIDPDCAKLEGTVKITQKDGSVVEKHVKSAVGSLEHPMSDKEIENKFLYLSKDIFKKEQAEAIMDLCWNMRTLTDISKLSQLLKA